MQVSIAGKPVRMADVVQHITEMSCSDMACLSVTELAPQLSSGCVLNRRPAVILRLLRGPLDPQGTHWHTSFHLSHKLRLRPGPARPHSAIYPKMPTTAILFRTQRLASAHTKLKLSPAELPSFCGSEKQRNESRLYGCDCQSRPVTRKQKSGCRHLRVSHS